MKPAVTAGARRRDHGGLGGPARLGPLGDLLLPPGPGPDPHLQGLSPLEAPGGRPVAVATRGPDALHDAAQSHVAPPPPLHGLPAPLPEDGRLPLLGLPGAPAVPRPAEGPGRQVPQPEAPVPARGRPERGAHHQPAEHAADPGAAQLRDLHGLAAARAGPPRAAAARVPGAGPRARLPRRAPAGPAAIPRPALAGAGRHLPRHRDGPGRQPAGAGLPAEARGAGLYPAGRQHPAGHQPPPPGRAQGPAHGGRPLAAGAGPAGGDARAGESVPAGAAHHPGDAHPDADRLLLPHHAQAARARAAGAGLGRPGGRAGPVPGAAPLRGHRQALPQRVHGLVDVTPAPRPSEQLSKGS